MPPSLLATASKPHARTPCADLHTPLLAPALSRRVAASLHSEFEAQAHAEIAAGIAVSVMLAHDMTARARNELGFIVAIVRPLCACGTRDAAERDGRADALSAAVHKLSLIAPPLAPLLLRIDANARAWESLL